MQIMHTPMQISREAVSDLSFPESDPQPQFSAPISAEGVKLVRAVCRGAKLCQVELRSGYVIVPDFLKPKLSFIPKFFPTSTSPCPQLIVSSPNSS